MRFMRILFFILYKLLNNIFRYILLKWFVIYIYNLYIFFYFILYMAPVETSPVTEGVALSKC